MTSKISQKTKGILTLTGSCFINLVLGSSYIWGNISIYVSSYYKNVTSDEGSIVFPIATSASTIGILISFSIVNLIGFRALVILSSLAMFSFVFTSSYSSNFFSFFICFVGYGFSGGLLYLTLLFNTYKYFPDKRGLIGGIGMCSVGLSAFLSNYLLLCVMNPDDIMAEKNLSTGEYFFKEEITQRLPSALQYLAFYFLALLIIGNLLQIEFKDIKEEPNPTIIELAIKIEKEKTIDENNKKENLKSINLEESEKDEHETSTEIGKKAVNKKIEKTKLLIINDKEQTYEENQCVSLKHAFQSKCIYLLIIMVFFSISNGYFIATNFKNYGITKIPDDRFLTLVGSLSSLCNGGGRLLCGLLYDKFKFKKVYMLLLLIQMVNIVTLRLASNHDILYLIWICVALLCEGGHFVLFPALCWKVYGHNVGSKVYSVLLIVGSFSNLTQFGVNLMLRNKIGYENEFYVFLAFTFVSFLVCCFSEIRFKL